MTIRANLEALDRRKRKGTDEQVAELRRRYDAGELIKDLVKDFPWRPSQALAIAKREARRDVG